jgi:hypothetical protein
MVSSLLAGINALLVDRGGLMPESLTRKKRRHHRQDGRLQSEWWPDLFRKGGRLQIGIPAGFMSVRLAGLNRNPQAALPAAVSALDIRERRPINCNSRCNV